MQDLAKLGASTAGTVAELAQKSDIVITMLPATAHVQSVLTGPQGILANIKPGSLLVDSSTIDPIVSRQLIKEAGDKGVRMIDAPVSGGVTGNVVVSICCCIMALFQNNCDRRNDSQVPKLAP